MAKVNFGFTPDFQRTLAGMGIDFAKMQAAASAHLASPASSQFAPVGWDPNVAGKDPYFKLKAAGINTEGMNLNDSRVAGQVKRAGISPDVQKLYDQVIGMRQVEAQRGGPDTSPHKGFFNKVLDVLNTPGRAITTAVYRENAAVKNAENQNKSFADWRGVGQFASGFKQGWHGQDPKTGVDILRDQFNVKNKAALFAGGLAIDIGADPLSYVGFGIGKNLVTKGAVATGKATATEKAAQEVAAKMAAGSQVSKSISLPNVAGITKSLGGGIDKILSPTAKGVALRTGATDIGKVSTILGLQAGKSAQLAIASDLTKLGFDSKSALASARKYLNPKSLTDPAVANEKAVYGDLIKKLPGMNSSKHLDQTFEGIFQDAKQTTEKQLTEILSANMEQQIKRTVNIKGVGFEAPISPIPGAAINTMSKLARAPVLEKVVGGFNKTFNTGSGFDHELYITKSRAAGKAEQRINLGQQKIVKVFTGIHKDQRVGYMRALVTSPGNFGRGVLKGADGTDVGDFAHEMLSHFGQYIDWTGKGTGIISLQKLNSYLPHNFKFDSSILKNSPHLFNPIPSKGGQNFLNLIHAQKDDFANVDPQNLLYHMHIGVEKALARDQFMRAVADLGVPLKANKLTTDPVIAQAIRQGSGAARELVKSHGYAEITTKTTREMMNEVDPSWHRYLKDRVFHPDVRAGIIPMLNMMDDQKQIEGIARMYDKAIGYFKKSVTLPMPSYHIRNSIGDLLTSYVDGVGGVHGTASYAQAAKVMRMINPVSKNDQLKQILEAPVTAEGKIADPMQEIAKLLQGGKQSVSGNLIMKKNPKWADVPGKYVSAEQFQAAYQHMGLKRGYVATDLAHELRGNPNLIMKAMHAPTDWILNASQSREDYFRMAHFIDRIKRSKATSFSDAAKEAAFYVKKHHFDYSDVTPTERAVFSRAIPFYKFQRFATPLMLQMFFANPGKILNAQKVFNNMSYASGYKNDGGFLPTADAIMPQYMRDAMMIPLFENKGNTNYFGNNTLPSTSIFAQTLGLGGSNPSEIAGQAGQNLVQSTTPLAQIFAEKSSGKRVLGGFKIPIKDKHGSEIPYWMSKTPPTNLAWKFSHSADNPDNMSRLINMMSGLGISENTPARQKSELYREKDVIKQNRKYAGFVAPKTSRSH